MGKQHTLDDYLRKISLKDKDVAVVGPNYSVSDDPSLLYFANRMLRHKNSSITVLDAKPHWTGPSHGNIYNHLDEVKAMVWKGVHIKEPGVIIGDVTETDISSQFDMIYETGTFKCIVNLKAEQSKSKKYAPPAKKVLDSYHQMLKPNGTALFVFTDGMFEVGYSVLVDLLEKDSRFDYNLEPYFFVDQYKIRNFNDREVRSRGRKKYYKGEYVTSIGVNKDNSIYLGSKWKEMRIIKAVKN